MIGLVLAFLTTVLVVAFAAGWWKPARLRDLDMSRHRDEQVASDLDQQCESLLASMEKVRQYAHRV